MDVSSRAGWITSSRSGPDNEFCVEVRMSVSVGVRDTKNRAGGALSVRTADWATFVAAAKDGRYDLSV
ncbi:DUF397 domain-containing protein [Actinokineospora sp.]|uniref:DUF397 domain-containing protein n=1 Tax=Actinokineospora sp. TaxID=1872133 RepID=UPI004037E593